MVVTGAGWGSRSGWLAALVAAALWLPAPALGQPPASNPNEMCGDGTTFTVHLPGRAGSFPLGLTPADDSVTLPQGCDIYAIFVSGYSVNPMLNYLSFYKLARFVAERNGYVHYAWWNNFMGEYLRGPLHGAGLPESRRLSPGGATHALGFVPEADNDAPKALPEEDTQFQVDAARVLAAIRERNPNALIVVAGHSMGGNAVVRLASNIRTPIDLLAPIDPVGNRSDPVGSPHLGTFNWTRWRVSNELLGYRQRDCERVGLLCRDTDPNLFRFAARCVWGPLLDEPPLVGSRAPVFCPQLLPRVVSQRARIGGHVRMLYHRWQQEFPFPFDFQANELIDRGPLTPLLGGNYQEPVLRNAEDERNPNKTCGHPGSNNITLIAAQVFTPGFLPPNVGVQPGDPRDPDIFCNPFDGHGEIVGLRGALTPYGVRAPQWPCYTGVQASETSDDCDEDLVRNPDEAREARRAKLIAMASAPPPHPDKTINRSPDPLAWEHEPRNPHLDLVVDDMITIVQHLLDQQPSDGDDVAPVTVASLSPAAEASGWHADDVQVTLSASDAGSGVTEVEHSTAGAQFVGPTVTAGNVAQELITVEGITTVRFFARDAAGNVEAPQEFVVRLDRTPPEITAETGTAPNEAGWFNRPVMVSFPAFDALSGLAESSPEQTVAAEGAAQEVLGTAEDLAGNLASAAAILNIDLTAPTVALTSPSDGAVVLLNGALTAGYACADALSGLASCEGTLPDGAAIDTSVPGDRTFSVLAADVAGNVSAATHAYAVRYGFSGFLQLPIRVEKDPVDPRAGRVVRVLWGLHDAGGRPIGDVRTFVSLSSAPAACDGSGAGAAEPAASAGGSPVSYVTGLRQFAFNWKTDASWAGTCRQLQLRLADGAVHTTVIRFR